MKTPWQVFGTALWLVATGLVGCAHDTGSGSSTNPDGGIGDDDDSFAQDGTDTSNAESDAQLVTSSLVSSSANGTIGLASTELSSDDIEPQTLGDGIRAVYRPVGCLHVTSDSTTSTVTYAFGTALDTPCRFGPNGLNNISGTLSAKYTSANDTLHLDILATDLKVNGATLTISASADVSSDSASGVDRKMVWNANISGTTGAGRDFVRTNTRTVTWTLGGSCYTINGESDGQIKKREIKTDVENFQRCRASCPSAGGEITVTNVTKNKQIDMRYDGSDKATYTGVNGKEVLVPLLCAAN